MRCFVLSFLVFSCLGFFAVPPALAQAPVQEPLLFNPNTTPPDINSVPALSNMVRSGAKLFYMGERSGLFGWFIVKNGQVQMVYVTPDKKTALIGGMFTGEGENVTGQQITVLTDTNKEVAALVSTSAKQQEDVMKAGSVSGGFASTPGAGSSSQGSLPAVALSPGERLLQDMQAAAGVMLGNNENAEINIVVSPTCPHCKALWRELRNAVASNNVRVHLVPVANPADTDDMRAAAQLLGAANPLEAWEKHVGGDKSALAGVADSVRLQAVSSNNALADNWNIKATPYLVYRAKDGRVKIVQGEPKRMSAVLTDLIK